MQVTLTATASTGNTFVGWSGDCAGSNTTCTLSMTANQSVTATFETSNSASASIVTSALIYQNWEVGSWSASSVQLNVQAGDAIFVLGMYWNSAGKSVAPSDNNGTLVAAINQTSLSNGSPPVGAQIYYEINAGAGTHTIKPPNLGGGDGDGTLYVLQVRGLSTSAKLVESGNSHATGTAMPGVSTNLTSNAQEGDFVVAIGGYDNTAAFSSAEITDPPNGWESIGAQNDATNNVPSEACYRLAPSADNEAVSWTWADPRVNVTSGAIAAFR